MSISSQRGHQRFARSRRRQDREFQRPRHRRWTLPNARDKGGNIGIGHGRMVATCELAGLRQQLVEMAAPAGGIGLPFVDDARAPSQHPALPQCAREDARRFRSPRPPGLKNRKHGFRVDLVNRRLADRFAIGRERHRPLRLVLLVPPAPLVRRKEFVSRLPERQGGFRVRLVPFGDRIEAGLDE